MPNPKGNISTLKKYESKWNSGKTQTIRVPVSLASRILEYAHEIDNEAVTQVNEMTNNGANQSMVDIQQRQLKESLLRVVELLEEVKKATPRSFSEARRRKLIAALDLVKTLYQANKE